MSDIETVNIKQRLIGALVLVSLGIILIPLLLNGGADVTGKISGNNIPDMPQALHRELPIVPEPMLMPERKVITAYPQRGKAETTLKQPAAQPEAAVTVKIKPKPESSAEKFKKLSRPESAAINKAYTLQIASFSQKSNAYALQAKLRKKKYKAYIEAVQTAKGRVYRLRVGPYLKFEQISAIKKTIEKKFKLSNTVIVKY